MECIPLNINQELCNNYFQPFPAIKEYSDEILGNTVTRNDRIVCILNTRKTNYGFKIGSSSVFLFEITSLEVNDRQNTKNNDNNFNKR